MKIDSSCLLLIVLLSGCNLDTINTYTREIGVVEGYVPIYGDSSDLVIRIEDPKPIGTAGKIYSYQNLLLVNELNKGIHIYDNTDPRNPVNMKYIGIPGNNDVAIKNGVLYADSFDALVTLEITPDTVKVLNRIEGVMPFSRELPPAVSTYYECIDRSKGVVIGWELSEIQNPECFAQ